MSSFDSSLGRIKRARTSDPDPVYQSQNEQEKFFYNFGSSFYQDWVIFVTLPYHCIVIHRSGICKISIIMVCCIILSITIPLWY